MMDWQDLLLWITIFQLSAIVVWELLGHYAFFKIPMLRRCPVNEPDVLNWGIARCKADLCGKLRTIVTARSLFQ